MAGLGDMDDLIQKYNSPDEQGRYRQGFELDYNQYRDFERRNEEAQRRAEDMQRQAEERIRRFEEQQRERERQAQRYREVRRPNFQPHQPDFDYIQQLLGGTKSESTKSSKERMVERLAVKFCFFQQRIMSMQTNFVLGNKSTATEKLRLLALSVPVPALLDKILASVVEEGVKNKISRKEILEAIAKMLVTTLESKIGELFVNHYLGAFALKIVQKNPNIIKDKNIKKNKPKHSSETIDIDLEDDDALTTFQRMQRMLDDMQERRIGVDRNIEWGDGIQGWIRRQGMPIVDYPDFLGDARPLSPSVIEMLRNFRI